jgi:peptidylprolyl isomerase
MQKSVLLVALLLAAAVLAAGCTGSAPANTTTVQPTGATTSMVSETAGDRVRLETSMGNITIRLYPDMPVTAGNFRKLVQEGFYDGVIFHRVMADFMIQGGCPYGNGMGGPGYTIKDEFTDHNRNDRGTISMANTGYPNTGGSQFFINVVNNNYLDRKHPVFGEVVEGMDVVDRISKVQTDRDDLPLQNVTIIKATVL